jgi:phage tail protein X
MNIRVCILALALSSVGIIPCPGSTFQSTGNTPGINTQLAADYFREAADLSRADSSKLWEVSLYGPMLFVDSDSRGVVANQADAQSRLRAQGGVFTGKLPDDVNMANTATRWAGIKWTMIIWPLPDERRERLRLMAHELFHRIQDQVGLKSSETSNRHLDSQEGRTWLRLEWRALERALEERDVARREAIADAIYFRRYRQSLFPDSLAQECALESNEGLAEYTGVKLSSRSEAEARTRAAYSLNQAQNKQSFVRSFAYASGPAYGLLLDAAQDGWRRGFKAGGDMSAVLQRALNVNLPDLSAETAAVRAKPYDGDEVIAFETRRESIRRGAAAKYRAKLMDGPVLVIPAAGSFNYSFNPNNLVPLDDTGTVFPTMRVTDDWGILEVSDGALMIRSAGAVKELHVAAPSNSESRPISGDGWKLELNAGWTITPGQRKGDYVVSRQR